jgi:hypothetical protein
VASVVLDVLMERHSPPKPYQYAWSARSVPEGVLVELIVEDSDWHASMVLDGVRSSYGVEAALCLGEVEFLMRLPP